MEVRALNAGDFHTLVNIAGKISSDALIEITRSSTQINEIQAGFAFITAAMKYANSDIKGLLCSLVGLEPGDYDKQPFDFPIQIIEKVAEQEDLQTVFLRVKGLMKVLGMK